VPDPGTPFRVFSIKVENLKKDEEILDALVPRHKCWFCSQPYVAFFANEDGFSTSKPFKCMMDVLTKVLDCR